MPLPYSAELAGRLDRHVVTSELLRGNPLGDPFERPLWSTCRRVTTTSRTRRYPAST